MYMALVYIRAGVNSAPELEFIANSNSGIGIELVLSSLELELPSLELPSLELKLPSLECEFGLELYSTELYSELKSDMMSLV